MSFSKLREFHPQNSKSQVCRFKAKPTFAKQINTRCAFGLWGLDPDFRYHATVDLNPTLGELYWETIQGRKHFWRRCRGPNGPLRVSLPRATPLWVSRFISTYRLGYFCLTSIVLRADTSNQTVDCLNWGLTKLEEVYWFLNFCHIYNEVAE